MLRSAEGMNSFTKESIDNNIEEFCESAYREIEFSASNGYFNCKLKFQNKVVPYKDDKSGLYYLVEELKKLGYNIVALQLPTNPKKNGNYTETEECFIKVSWEQTPSIIENVDEKFATISNEVFSEVNNNAIQYTITEK